MALLLFKNLHDTAQDLNTLTFLTKFNSVTNAVGPTIADTLVLQERYKKFMDRMESDAAPFSPSAIRVLENSPILNAFYDTTISDSGASRLIFEDYFPHYSPTFSSILDAVRSRIKGNLTSKQINKLVNAFVMYKLTLGETPIIDGSYDNRKHYIIDFIREFSKAAEEHPDNALLKVFRLVPRSKKCPVSTLEAKTGGYSIDLQETIKNAWSNLMLNPKTNKFGSDLFIYNILRSGFSYSPKTAGHLASVDVKLGFDNYIETIRDPKFNDGEVLLGVFINQFLRNNTSEYSLVPRVEFNKKTVQVKETKGKLSISFDGKKSSIDNIITSTSSYGTIYAPVIIYNDKVYMNPKEIGTSVVYTETTPLGNTNNFVEYDGNDTGEMKSVLKQQVYSREKSSTAETTGDYRKSWTTNEIMKVLKSEFGEEEYEAFKDTENKASFVNSIIDELAEKMKVDPKNETFREKAKEKLKKRIEDFC